ncbi:carbonic anhydrase [Streptomyces sp. cmx-4-9]|uniref:carbonic anhydrase n=1 Tax=Streptomyces sp. cmx-4-9 TaxID=2790941 RepID=UPI00397FB098
MQPLIDNARTFGQRPEEFAKLAEGQSPRVLFITCSDSRPVPAPVTGAAPGELFELRTAGDTVPPYASGRPPCEATTTIEYAANFLGVQDIVVCGHTHCGAVAPLVRGNELDPVPAIRDWLAHAADRPAEADPDPVDPALAASARHHLLAQMLRLRSYPCVESGPAEGRLRLRSWCYEAHTGAVLEHCADTDTFQAL